MRRGPDINIGVPRPGLAPWLVFLFALLVRLAVIDGTIGFHTPVSAEPASDSQIHIALVQSLLDGHGYSFGGAPTAITPPLYIFFLTGLYGLIDDPVVVRLGQAVLGAASCLVMYAISRRMSDHTTGLLTAAILSIYPLVVYLTGLHLTENLFLFMLLLVMLQALRLSERPTFLMAAGLGGLIGLAALTRAVFVVFIPFLLVWTVSVWGIRHPLAYRMFGVAAVSAMLVVLPWTIRNYLVLGAVVPIQGNAGMVFWAGNNPHADGGLVWPTRETWTGSRPPDDGAYGWRGLSATAANRHYAQTALSWIREHPRDYMRLLGRKLVRLYGFTRAADKYDLHVPGVVILFHMFILASAAAGVLLTIHQWRTFCLPLLLIIFTNVTTLLFSGGTRYTIPMIPSLTLLSAVALTAASQYVGGPFGLDRKAVSD